MSLNDIWMEEVEKGVIPFVCVGMLLFCVFMLLVQFGIIPQSFVINMKEITKDFIAKLS